MSVPLSSPLLQINTRLGTTTLKFRVDTGASISIIPASRLNGVMLNPTPVSLTTANGEKIKCHGQANLEIGIPSLKRSFSWTFVVADITNPLLGFDFLNEFGLIIDCKNKTIYDPLTATKKELVLNTTSPVNVVINKVELPSFIQTSLDKYPEIISPHINKNNNYCGVYHRIDTGSHLPVFAKSRQLSAEKLSATKEEFKRLINEGVITPSDSEWSSPLHLVPKQSGGYRCCGDYRALNSITKSDRYPIPNINSFTTKLANKQRFTKIDLISAYHQIKMHPDDIPKTAIICPLGLFHYEFMPFGLKNSSATFQRYMDRIFRQIDCVFIYLDDILIFSDDEPSHKKDIDTVFKILQENNLKISLSKSIFTVTSLDFLGFRINSNGITPTANKVKEIESFPCPTDAKSLRRFLGIVGFYRKLIPGFAKLVLPLSERMRLTPKGLITLNNLEKQSFSNIIKILGKLTELSHPQPTCTQYQLVTDSSKYAVGAALHQVINGNPIPIGFFSKKLTTTQTRYSTFDRELLAAYLSVLHFRHLIEGREVLLLTDHKPICGAFHSLKPAKSDRQQRQLAIITELISDIAHVKGNQNVVADCLSRPTFAVQIDIYDLPALADAQKSDTEIQSFPDLKKFTLSGKDQFVLCDTSTSYPRPFVPCTLRKSIFDSLHAISHPGIK